MIKQLYLKNLEGKGRGVFCKRQIVPNEIIEIAPLIVISEEQKPWLYDSKLNDYFFTYRKGDQVGFALALGFGSLYNHAEFSNAGYCMDYENDRIEIFAIDAILPNTEICINYGGEYGKSYAEWFECRNISCKK